MTIEQDRMDAQPDFADAAGAVRGEAPRGMQGDNEDETGVNDDDEEDANFDDIDDVDDDDDDDEGVNVDEDVDEEEVGLDEDGNPLSR